MSVEGEIYDDHTVYLYTASLPSDVVVAHVNFMHRKAVDYIKSVDLSFTGCLFYRNEIKGRNNAYSEKSILWIEDKRVFYILVGLGLDGREINDPLIDHSSISLDGDIWRIEYQRYSGKIPGSPYDKYKIICQRMDGDVINDELYDKIVGIINRYKVNKIFIARARGSNKMITIRYQKYYATFPLAMLKFFEVDGITLKCNYARMR